MRTPVSVVSGAQDRGNTYKGLHHLYPPNQPIIISKGTIMPSSPAQVCIVGAGPAGLTLAIFLAQQKIPIAVYDALPQGKNGSRAAGIHAYTLEVCLRDSHRALILKLKGKY